MPAGENDRGGDRPFLEKIRSSMTSNLILQEAPATNPFEESALPIYCHGPLCKTFICYIDTLPIGHSLLIQLKGTFRYNHFQSVRHCSRATSDVTRSSLCFVEIRSFQAIRHRLERQCSSPRDSIEFLSQQLSSARHDSIEGNNIFSVDKDNKDVYFSRSRSVC